MIGKTRRRLRAELNAARVEAEYWKGCAEYLTTYVDDCVKKEFATPTWRLVTKTTTKVRRAASRPNNPY